MCSYTTLLPPSPLGRLLRCFFFSGMDTSFTNLRILFQHKKKSNVFTKISEKQTRSLPSSSSSRSLLIFWDTFPTYLRIIFQQKKKKTLIIFAKIGKKEVGPLKQIWQDVYSISDVLDNDFMTLLSRIAYV